MSANKIVKKDVKRLGIVETRMRLVQLADALEQVDRMYGGSVSGSLRRAVALLELCPWIETSIAHQNPTDKAK